MGADLTKRESHFEFGANWADYAKLIGPARIEAAVAGVKALLPDLAGKHLLDIGCGSGLHSLAALRLGAASITAVDIDENSVATTRRLLGEAAPGGPWSVEQRSVFDLPDTQYDVVYSWGVLHHTGDMWRAIDKAASVVKPGGQLAIAIYAKTQMDKFWIAEKALYAKAPRPVQWVVRNAYMGLYLAGLAATGRRPDRFLREFAQRRGMSFPHDVHDWLGGYPYETATPEELTQRLAPQGFSLEVDLSLPYSRGLASAGCHQMTYRRAAAGQAA